VTALCPGPVHTEFDEVANRQEHRRKQRNSLVHVPVEKVARAGLEAIERDKPLVIPGIAMKIAMAITRALPLSLLRVAYGIVKDDWN